MPSLSSCYFCGTALDAPIDSYPVVPEGLPIDAEHTVSLCPTCQRKLHGALEIAFDAATDADSIGTTLDRYDDLPEEETATAVDGDASALSSTESTFEAAPDDPDAATEADDESDVATEA